MRLNLLTTVCVTVVKSMWVYFHKVKRITQNREIVHRERYKFSSRQFRYRVHMVIRHRLQRYSKLYGSLKYGNAHNTSKNIVYGGDVNERHPVHLNCIIFNLPPPPPFFEEEDGLASSAQGIPVQDHHSSLLWLCTDLHDANPKDYTSMFSGTSAS